MTIADDSSSKRVAVTKSSVVAEKRFVGYAVSPTVTTATLVATVVLYTITPDIYLACYIFLTRY